MRTMRCAAWLAAIVATSLILFACQKPTISNEDAQSEGRGRLGKDRPGEDRNPGMWAKDAASPLSSAQSQRAAELYAERCAGCHGRQRQGGAGPSLVDIGLRRPQAKIEKIAQFGKGRKKEVSMPAGLVSAEEARLLATWLRASTKARAPASSQRQGADVNDLKGEAP